MAPLGESNPENISNPDMVKAWDDLAAIEKKANTVFAEEGYPRTEDEKGRPVALKIVSPAHEATPADAPDQEALAKRYLDLMDKIKAGTAEIITLSPDTIAAKQAEIDALTLEANTIGPKMTPETKQKYLGDKLPPIVSLAPAASLTGQADRENLSFPGQKADHAYEKLSDLIHRNLKSGGAALIVGQIDRELQDKFGLFLDPKEKAKVIASLQKSGELGPLLPGGQEYAHPNSGTAVDPQELEQLKQQLNELTERLSKIQAAQKASTGTGDTRFGPALPNLAVSFEPPASPYTINSLTGSVGEISPAPVAPISPAEPAVILEPSIPPTETQESVTAAIPGGSGQHMDRGSTQVQAVPAPESNPRKIDIEAYLQNPQLLMGRSFVNVVGGKVYSRFIITEVHSDNPPTLDYKMENDSHIVPNLPVDQFLSFIKSGAFRLEPENKAQIAPATMPPAQSTLEPPTLIQPPSETIPPETSISVPQTPLTELQSVEASEPPATLSVPAAADYYSPDNVMARMSKDTLQRGYVASVPREKRSGFLPRVATQVTSWFKSGANIPEGAGEPTPTSYLKESQPVEKVEKTAEERFAELRQTIKAREEAKIGRAQKFLNFTKWFASGIARTGSEALNGIMILSLALPFIAQKAPEATQFAVQKANELLQTEPTLKVGSIEVQPSVMEDSANEVQAQFKQNLDASFANPNIPASLQMFSFPDAITIAARETVWQKAVEIAKKLTDDKAEQYFLGDYIKKRISAHNPSFDLDVVQPGTTFETKFMDSAEEKEGFAKAQAMFRALSDAQKANMIKQGLKK